MNKIHFLSVLSSTLAGILSAGAADLPDYKTVDTATASRVSLSAPGQIAQPGYLGVRVAADDKGRLIVADIKPDSPAVKAGLQLKDIVTQVDGQPVARVDMFRERLQTKAPNDAVKLAILREDKPMELTATLTTTSRPMKATGQQFSLGVQFSDPKDGATPIDRVTPGSLGEKAGLKPGDGILKLEGKDFPGSTGLADLLAAKKPGDSIALLVRRDGKEVEVKVELVPTQGPRPGGGFGTGGGGGPGLGTPSLWKKELLRVAIVGIDFSDVKHNAKIEKKNWEEALFSRGISSETNATGQPVFGSLNDYFLEQSCEAFHIEGKMFDWVEVSKKRAEYAEGFGTGNKTAVLAEAVEKLLTRDGKDSLKDYDALFFLYAGDPVRTNKGAIYYPHNGSVSLRNSNQRWMYVLAPEGAAKMTSLSTYVREFGLMLGLQDLAARTENAGSEGCGQWCLLSDPMADGRPQHLCAWAKEQLGWLKPTVIDPAVKQKLILAPVERSAKECFKVLVRPDGSEYFLLENRKRKGFDANLPGEGLLIWRVVNGKPILEESHGVEGAAGPNAFKELVPFPSSANNAFTPMTTPSSRSPKGGGLPVSITEIRRLADGRISFHIGYEFQ